MRRSRARSEAMMIALQRSGSFQYADWDKYAFLPNPAHRAVSPLHPERRPELSFLGHDPNHKRQFRSRERLFRGTLVLPSAPTPASEETTLSVQQTLATA